MHGGEASLPMQSVSRFQCHGVYHSSTIHGLKHDSQGIEWKTDSCRKTETQKPQSRTRIVQPSGSQGDIDRQLHKADRRAECDRQSLARDEPLRFQMCPSLPFPLRGSSLDRAAAAAAAPGTCETAAQNPCCSDSIDTRQLALAQLREKQQQQQSLSYRILIRRMQHQH